MALPQFLEDAPSHFNWKLEIDTSKTFDSLHKPIVERLKFNQQAMTIQTLLFQSWLHMSSFKNPKPDPTSFKACLEKTYEKIDALTDEDEKSGYCLVAKCNEAIVKRILQEPDTNDLEGDIEDFIQTQTYKAKACIDSVRAFALSRLGLPKYKDAEKYFREALKTCPKNLEWLFCLALVIGQQARAVAPPNTFTDEMKEEQTVLEEILISNNQHAFAHAYLAQLLLRNEDNDGALKHAGNSLRIPPENPELYSMAAKVFRRTKQYDEAIRIGELASKLNGENSYDNHMLGLAYRDKHNSQKCKGKKANEFLKLACDRFQKAFEANPTNNMALLDKARAHADLGELDEAEADFKSLLGTKYLSARNMFTFNYRYALFLIEKRKYDEKAGQHFRTAIELAVKHCTEVPVTRENPKPKFDIGIKRDIETAVERYRAIMNFTFKSSPNPEKVAQGLKGLAWLHQVLGEHDAAKESYEEYLQYDGKSTDHNAIHELIMTLIQLDDLEGARAGIEVLKPLKRSARLVLICNIEVLLRQGELHLQEATLGGTLEAKDCFRKEAKDCFRKAISIYKSVKSMKACTMRACTKLYDVLKNEAINTWEFRRDCAMIHDCCEENGETDNPLFAKVITLMKLDDETYGTLRNKHHDMERLILKNSSEGNSKEILISVSDVIDKARSLLDHLMIKFQEVQYPNPGIINPNQRRNLQPRYFFYIAQEDSNTPRTEHDVKTGVMKKLKEYKWENFDTRFPDLLDFLVQIQPAYPGNNDNWYIALNILNNYRKHQDGIKYSEYDIPVILNGKKASDPIPVLTVTKVPDVPIPEPTATKSKVAGVEYEPFEVTEVARKATTKVEMIYDTFKPHLQGKGTKRLLKKVARDGACTSRKD